MARLRRRSRADDGAELDGAVRRLSVMVRTAAIPSDPGQLEATLDDVRRSLNRPAARVCLAEVIDLAEGSAVDIYTGNGWAAVVRDGALEVTTSAGTVTVHPLDQGDAEVDELRARREANP